MRKPGFRRTVTAVLSTAALGGAGVLALGSGATSSAATVQAQEQVSENWAGYIVGDSKGDAFSSVSGSWVEPSAGSASGSGQGYSAFWVGLGGAGQASQSLEQVGTALDTAGGGSQYYAWYELVPNTEQRLNVAIHPGDRISARVGVKGTQVAVWLRNDTTGASVTKDLQMSSPDTSSAEWIAEAPSTYGQGGGYQTLPLADFGKITFTGASATAGGHPGSISDPRWTVQQVQLSSSGGQGPAGGGPAFVQAGAASDQSSAGAQPSSLSADGSSFDVSYAPASGQSSATGSGGPGDVYVYVPGAYEGYGGSGSGYGGAGYGGYSGAGYGGYGYGGYGYGGY